MASPSSIRGKIMVSKSVESIALFWSAGFIAKNSKGISVIGARDFKEVLIS